MSMLWAFAIGKYLSNQQLKLHAEKYIQTTPRNENSETITSTGNIIIVTVLDQAPILNQHLQS